MPRRRPGALGADQAGSDGQAGRTRSSATARSSGRSSTTRSSLHAGSFAGNTFTTGLAPFVKCTIAGGVINAAHKAVKATPAKSGETLVLKARSDPAGCCGSGRSGGEAHGRGGRRPRRHGRPRRRSRRGRSASGSCASARAAEALIGVTLSRAAWTKVALLRGHSVVRSWNAGVLQRGSSSGRTGFRHGSGTAATRSASPSGCPASASRPCGTSRLARKVPIEAERAARESGPLRFCGRFAAVSWALRADVAQLVEHWLPKPGVVGSSPIVRFSGAPP